MDRAVYEAMAAEEDQHWWFVGRRAVLSDLIRRRAAPVNGARVLDMGCGSGGNMAMLAKFGELEAIEYDAPAREIAAARGIAPVAAGGLPDGLDVEDGRFGLIGLFDVLEHVEQDVASLKSLGEKLAPDGRLVISVPALPWLWSEHDVSHHHFRRYTRATLGKAIADAGLQVEGIGYFNTLLFPVALVQRLVQKLTGLGKGAAGLPSPPVNTALQAIFSLERHLIGRVPLPIGLSLWAIARRK
jgi:SAM-dependent methyltransferase